MLSWVLSYNLREVPTHLHWKEMSTTMIGMIYTYTITIGVSVVRHKLHASYSMTKISFLLQKFGIKFDMILKRTWR